MVKVWRLLRTILETIIIIIIIIILKYHYHLHFLFQHEAYVLNYKIDDNCDLHNFLDNL